ncbi:MAG: DNA polymerase III subunit epsilon [Gammaproteobacteria bacterium]|nr:DNA polymerase III subunit epsilon [Gammaproteobacteria bacterium]
MRQIVLDTETTGLEPAQGHRVIEIGAVELLNRRLTGKRYHQYLQPDRDIDPGAMEVHGITPEFLADKPRFREIVDDFLAFVNGAELVIHNAPFDIGFLDHELRLLGEDFKRMQAYCTVADTLVMARQLHPGQKNNLDALCRRYNIDNAHRELHGALLDAEILADVYLAMSGGQASLALVADPVTSGANQKTVIRLDRSTLPPLKIQYADALEISAHHARLDALDKASGGQCVWRKAQE